MNVRSRSLFVVAVLAIGLVFVYGDRFAPTLFGGPQKADELTYVADLDYWQRTDRETEVVANARFDLDAQLTDVPLSLGHWQGEEVVQTNQEVMILLDPEQYTQRLYHDDKGHYVWLSMIGGRSSKPFHAPDICYDADGWTYDLSSAAVPLDGGGEIHGLWMHAKKQFPGESAPAEHIVFYFYLFPDRQRNLQDGIVLFKLTSGNFGSVEETLDVQRDFVRQLFTKAYTPGEPS
ncbi:MAG: exosortase-associated EpsI family protein [Caldilineaceae bacterium]